jgi:uncharacterized membrane protein
MKSKFRISLLILLAIIIIAQLIPIHKSNPESLAKYDYLVGSQAPEEIAKMVRTACYDCHSNQTVYPWYTHLAPFSWLIVSHVNEGRERLNFSEIKAMDAKKEKHQLHECAEVLEEGEMPLNSYLLLHAEARLTDDERKVLIEWFEKSAANINEEQEKE